MREIAVLVGVGVVIGIPATLAGGRLVSHMLFGLKGTDAESLLVAVAVLLGVGLIAGYLPARRASRVDPMVALRYEYTPSTACSFVVAAAVVVRLSVIQ